MIIFFLVFSLIFGSVLGSFLNCLAWRLYHGEGLWNRSHCPKCSHKISWYDNVPILSFLILAGSCRHCNQRISLQYPMAELAVSVLFGLAFYLRLGFLDDLTFMQTISSFNYLSLSLLRDWLVISFLAAIFIMDFKWYVVADEISLTGVVTVFATNLALGLAWPALASDFHWTKLLLGLAIGAGVFAIQYVLSRGTWVGSGDIRIGALMGVALGWPNTLVGLFLAYLIGAIAAIFLVVTGKKKFSLKHLVKPDSDNTEMILPFGPFLALGTVIAMFYGAPLITWYQNLIF